MLGLKNAQMAVAEAFAQQFLGRPEPLDAGFGESLGDGPPILGA
jgi:hypothetical protein